VRKEEARELKKEEPGLLVGSKYLFLKNPWNLTPKQHQQLAYLEKLNLKINRAYLLKEFFRELWFCPTRELAAQFLEKWLEWAESSLLAPLCRFARMVAYSGSAEPRFR
jgi:transposase